VFAVAGMGVLLLSSIGTWDFQVVQTLVVVLAVWVVVINFIADILYQLVDPRIRLG
jgi:ABC-type dipeptide/oligopeptide/nickel transport system permease component